MASSGYNNNCIFKFVLREIINRQLQGMWEPPPLIYLGKWWSQTDYKTGESAMFRQIIWTIKYFTLDGASRSYVRM